MVMGKQYDQLTLGVREKIAIWKAAGKSLRKIAELLGIHHSTVSREVKRNKERLFDRKCYWPEKADQKASQRKIDAAKRKRLKNAQIRNCVIKKIKQHCSPEQIAGRISIDHPGLKISYESIYQFIYQEAWNLFGFLACKHKRRRLRFDHRKPQHLPIPCRTSIDKRPEEINQRLVLGHWEADSMVSKANTSSVHVLEERKSRLLKISKMSRNSSRCVSRTIQRRLSDLPEFQRLSITYDNGPENRLHLKINRRLKSLSFFCHPYHSWEKGSVENSIGLVRRFIPKKTNLRKISKTKIQKIENLLNNRPKKCLNFQTPQEAFNSLSDKPLSGALPG